MLKKKKKNIQANYVRSQESLQKIATELRRLNTLNYRKKWKRLIANYFRQLSFRTTDRENPRRSCEQAMEKPRAWICHVISAINKQPKIII